MPESNAVRRLSGGTSIGPVTAETARSRALREPLLRFDQFSRHYEGATPQPARSEEPGWLGEVLQRLLEFTNLPDGWDGYKGSALRWDVGMFALNVLNSIMQSRTPVPHLVPSSEGALQIEWHQKDIDLEIFVTAPYFCEMSFVDRRTGANCEQELSGDFGVLAEPIAELTSRSQR